MIYGVGTDITDVRRFRKWVTNPALIRRFFNDQELFCPGGFPGETAAAIQEPRLAAVCQHYAARFAAKEAFAKALGTGFAGFDLRDVFVEKTANGKPELRVQKTAARQLEERCGACRMFISLSHEKEYATAVVLIETGG
jgi:holo-[acyl-carrier protein] synthase